MKRPKNVILELTNTGLILLAELVQITMNSFSEEETEKG